MPPQTRSRQQKRQQKQDSSSEGPSMQDNLELDESEVFRIIDKSDVLNGQFGGRAGSGTAAYEILRPSQLDEAIKRQTDRTPQRTGAPAARKLVELIDSEEADAAGNHPKSSVDGPDSGEVSNRGPDDPEPALSEFGEEMFRLILNMIVFGTLWLCLDIMIHAQYGQETTFREELGRAVNVLPGLAFVIYMTSHHSSHVLSKAALVAFSVIGGSHMIYCINTQSYLAVMKRCPALGTLWIWSIVQLDLSFAVSSLVAVAAYVKWKGLHIVFS